MEKFFRDNSPESLEQWRKQPMDQALYEDPFQGMRLRNGLGLWLKERPLRDRFWENYQIVHADDVSTAILQTIWRVLNGERHQIEKYAASCREHWASLGYAPGDEMPIADLPADPRASKARPKFGPR
jgi:hypothetical protein